jgi:hypothetical protein
MLEYHYLRIQLPLEKKLLLSLLSLAPGTQVYSSDVSQMLVRRKNGPGAGGLMTIVLVLGRLRYGRLQPRPKKKKKNLKIPSQPITGHACHPKHTGG